MLAAPPVAKLQVSSSLNSHAIHAEPAHPAPKRRIFIPRDTTKGIRMQPCEIVYSKDAKGWQWRVTAPGDGKKTKSRETFRLFYDCVSAARAEGLQPPNVRCL